MGNRFTEQNMTKRQMETIEGIRYKLEKVFMDLKNLDNPSSEVLEHERQLLKMINSATFIIQKWWQYRR
jgi:hypothetical protein